MKEFVPANRFELGSNCVRYHFDQIDSTSDWPKRHLASFDKNKVILVTADRQLRGRGRKSNRRWHSPSSNLYATFCCFLPRVPENIANTSQVMSVVIAQILKEFLPSLKWPNDILIHGKKVGGVMCEIHDNWALIGIGINVNMTQEELQTVGQPATSLSVEKNHSYSVEEILNKLAEKFFPAWLQFSESGFAPFFGEYLELTKPFVGKHIEFQTETQLWKGVFLGVNPSGFLRLGLPDEKERLFSSGNIL